MACNPSRLEVSYLYTPSEYESVSLLSFLVPSRKMSSISTIVRLWPPKALRSLSSLESLAREAEIEYAKKHLMQKRGMEMPLQWDPRHINDFFWKQSNEWGAIANEHISKIYEHCKNYFEYATLISFQPEDVRDAKPAFTNWKTVASRVFQQADKRLELRKEEAERELEKIEKDRRRFQINLNVKYTVEYRQQKNQRNMATAVGAFVKDMEPPELNANTLAENQRRQTPEDQTTVMAEDFLRAAWIHYRVRSSQPEILSVHG